MLVFRKRSTWLCGRCSIRETKSFTTSRATFRIIPASCSATANLCRSEPRPINEFRVLAEDIERVITPRSKALLLSFPTNPTGGILRAADLKPIADLCRRHDLLVLSDEIYSELAYDGAEHISIASLPGMKERTVALERMFQIVCDDRFSSRLCLCARTNY